MTDTLVLYHGACRDGFCAAWVVNKYFQLQHTVERNANDNFVEYPKIEYIPVYYGQEPSNVKDKNVIIVDFCYPLETMEKIAVDCKSLIWLDHHKTAQPIANWFEQNKNRRDIFVFDNNRSGAGIAWDYFFPNEHRPWLVDYIEDRDLWIKKLPNTDAINAYISLLKFDFKVWDNILDRQLDDIEEYGHIAMEKTEQYVREVCKNVYFADIYEPDSSSPYEPHAYKKIPIVNICQVDCSEVLEELYKIYPLSPFSLYWFKRADGMYQYGLRSIGDFDVSVVAKLFGGGGHRNAAGFQLPYLLEELK